MSKFMTRKKQKKKKEKKKKKKFFKKKNKLCQLYLKNNSNMLATKLETLLNLIYETLESCKGKYYENISKKLCSKAIYYWSLLKTMLSDKKYPCIPPIFHDNKFVTDFSNKFLLFFTITNLLLICY